MEKVCEFCMALRPAVYCQADSALLCLSCDSKVHSANALSNRHPRSLLCDSCRVRPASVRCKDHRMFMCQSCDRSLHSSSGHASQQQHQKRVISSYIGCPSAKDFAAIWDLDLNELTDVSRSTLNVSSLQEFVDSRDASLDAPMQYHWQQRRTSSISHNGQNQPQQQNQSSQFILQQILDLKRLQLNEGNCFSPMMRRKEEKDVSSSLGKALRRIDEATNENSQHSRDLEAEFLQSVTPLEELRSEDFASPFSSTENYPCSNAGVSLLGDSFWQCRSPLQTSQFMSQNIQDLGVCEDLMCRDDFNSIPEVDMTFQNFEELFGGDQDPARGLLMRDNDLSCSSLDRTISLDKSENSQAHVTEDASASSSIYSGSVAHVNSDTTLSKHRPQIQLSYSELSLSISQETEGRAFGSPDDSAADLEIKENAVRRHRDKKKARLDGDKTWRALPRERTGVGRRVKGKMGKSGHNSDDISTRNY
ncbi:hypothetical protein CRG98_010233 [Punica granatum]|uniref:B box-type domain-containing protein n=1 Tax=Punica granatum TaxID=22663 RepID=A0A2I0KLS5_PUNGR|nr:hypothetical protein CRG98_010233 [Punica granatum]